MLFDQRFTRLMFSNSVFFLCRPDKLSDRSCKGRDQRHAKVSEKILLKQSIIQIIGEALLNLRTEYTSLIEVIDASIIAANHFCV